MPRGHDPALLGGRALPREWDLTNRIGYQPPKVLFDVEAFIAQWTQFVETYLFPIIEELTGFDLTLAQTVLGKILGAFDGIDLDGDPGAVLDTITEAAASAVSIATTAAGAALQGLKDRLASVVDASDIDIDNWLSSLLTPASPLDASRLFGQLAINRVVRPAQWQLSTFDAGLDGWHTDTPAYCQWDAGAVKITASGAWNEAYTDEIPCSPGDVIRARARVKYSGVTPGAMFGIVLTGEGGAGVTPTLAEITTGGTSDWVELAGEYTMPSGYTGFKIWLSVSDAASAGVVHFDDVEIDAPGLDSASLLSDVLLDFLTGASDLDAAKLVNLLNIPEIAQDKITDLIDDLGLKLPFSIFGSKITTGSNLTLDPSFESSNIWPSGSHAWYAGAFSTDQAHSGAQSRKITMPAGPLPQSFALIVDPAANTTNAELRVQPGQKYYAEAWVFPHNSNVNTSANLGIWLQCIDSTGVNGPTWIAFAAGQHPAKNAWTKLSGYQAIPAGYDRVTPYFNVDTAGTVGDIYYLDDPLVREVTDSRDVATAQQALIDGVFQGIFGGASTGNSIASIKAGLAAFPTANLTGAIAAGWISGVLSTGNIPSLPASQIGSGTFAAGRLPDITKAMSTDMQAVIDNLYQAINGGSSTGNSTASVKTSVQAKTTDFIDSFFNALTGQSGTATPVSAFATHAAQLAATVSSLAGVVTDLTAVQTGQSTDGLVGGTDFGYVDTDDLGTDWSVTYNVAEDNYISVNGDEALWTRIDALNARHCKCRRTASADAVTLSDYQRIAMVTGIRVIERFPWTTSSDAQNSIYGRVNAAFTQYVRVLIDDDSVKLMYANGGSESQLGSTVTDTYQGVGVTWELICGTDAGLRVYQVLKNGSVILSVTDGSAVTAAGASNRGWGFGMGGGGQHPSSVTRIRITDTASIPPAAISHTFTGSSLGPFANTAKWQGNSGSNTTWTSGDITVTSGVAKEGNSQATNGSYWSGRCYPDPLAHHKHWCEVKFPASVTAIDRGNGAGIRGSDEYFTSGLFFVVDTTAGASALAIYTKIGPTITSRATANVTAAANDVFRISPTHNGWCWVYEVYKNGSGSPSVSWADTGNIVPLGPFVTPVFEHTYAAGQFASNGLVRLEADVL